MKNNSLKISGPIKKKLSMNESKMIYNIIKSENNFTIIGKLDFFLVDRFLKKIIETNKIFLFLLKSKKKIIGYSIYSKKPSYLMTEMKFLSLGILLNLIKTFCLLDIFNLIIKYTKIFDLFVSKEKINRLSNNFNLSYLAIHRSFQSKGYGEYFIKKNIFYLKKKFKLKYLSTDAKNPKTVNFYINKCKFKLYSTKFELFKIHKILIKKI